MNDFQFTNYALSVTEGNEFRVLYFIINTLRMKKASRCRIYSEVMSDYLNISKKTVTRITNSLEEKGLLKKELVWENKKSKVYYSLNYDVLRDNNDQKKASKVDTGVQISTTKVDTDVPLNRTYRTKKNLYVTKELHRGTNGMEELRFV